MERAGNQELRPWEGRHGHSLAAQQGGHQGIHTQAQSPPALWHMPQPPLAAQMRHSHLALAHVDKISGDEGCTEIPTITDNKRE